MLLTIQFRNVGQGYKYNIVPRDPNETPIVFYGRDHTEEQLNGALLIEGINKYRREHPAKLWHDLEPYRDFIVLDSSILAKWFHKVVSEPFIYHYLSDRTKYLEEIHRMYREVVHSEIYENSLIN